MLISKEAEQKEGLNILSPAASQAAGECLGGGEGAG